MKVNYKLIDFKTLGDDRGSLITIEEGYKAPFDIKRGCRKRFSCSHKS